MKNNLVIGLLLLIFFGLEAKTSVAQGSQSVNSEQLATYWSNTPCDNFVCSLLGTPKLADCNRINWSLSFYQDGRTQTSTTFTLTGTYGRQETGGPGFINGGHPAALNGQWT